MNFIQVFEQPSHLRAVCSRKFDYKQLNLLEHVFYVALRHGGDKELDFVRPEGMSFNPRPARIALVLINDASVRDVSTLAAGILAAIGPSISSDKVLLGELLANMDKTIISKANLSLESPESLLRCTEPYAQDASVISCASWLDRARHLHQANGSNLALLWTRSLRQTESYIELARTHSAPLYTLLCACKTRFMVNRRVRGVLKAPGELVQ